MPYRNFLFYIILPCIFWAPTMPSSHAGTSPPVAETRSAERDNNKKKTPTAKKQQVHPADETKSFYEKLDRLYTTPEFKKAVPQKKKLMAQQYFLSLKWTSLKSVMRLRLIKSILSWGVVAAACYFLPQLITYILGELTNSEKGQNVIKNLTSDDGSYLVGGISIFCSGLGYFWQFVNDNAPGYRKLKIDQTDNYLRQTSIFTKRDFMPSDSESSDDFSNSNQEALRKAFIFCVQQLVVPHTVATLLGILYAILRRENPFPGNAFTLIAFIFAPRAYIYTYITLRFFSWLYTKGYQQLLMPAVALLSGSLPPEVIQPVQIAYVGERHTLRRDLQQSIESKLFKAQIIGTRQAAVKAMLFLKQALRMHSATSRNTKIPVINSLDKATIHYQRFYANKLEKKLAYNDRKTIRASGSLLQHYLHGEPKRYLITGRKGTGKTFVIDNLGVLLHSPVARIDLSQCAASKLTGARDKPGRLVEALIKYRTPVAILLFDRSGQLTESTATRSKNLLNQLGKIFDKKNNHTFYSPYFQARFPMPSIVIFTLTTPPDKRSPSQILPKSLVDGAEHIKLPGYTPDQKVAMALGYYLPIVCDNLHIDKKSIIPMDYKYIEEEIRKLDGVDAIEVEATVYRCIRTRKQYHKRHMRVPSEKKKSTLVKQKKSKEAQTTPKVSPKKLLQKPRQPVKKETPPPALVKKEAQPMPKVSPKKPLQKPTQPVKKATPPPALVKKEAQPMPKVSPKKPLQKPTQPVKKATPPPAPVKKEAPIKKVDEFPSVITIRI